MHANQEIQSQADVADHLLNDLNTKIEALKKKLTNLSDMVNEIVQKSDGLNNMEPKSL